MRQKLAILILLSLLALKCFGDSGTYNSKELELKELALKEKVLVSKQIGPAQKNTKTSDAGGGKIESIYTGLAGRKCKTTSDDEIDVITQECPGLAGYKLVVAELDARRRAGRKIVWGWTAADISDHRN